MQDDADPSMHGDIFSTYLIQFLLLGPLKLLIRSSTDFSHILDFSRIILSVEFSVLRSTKVL